MIAFLTGTLLESGPPLLLLVGGVGYGIQVADKHTASWTKGQELSLWIHTHVSETSLELFGFPEQKEKKLFLLLLHVSGVGPRTALQLSALGSEQIGRAVREAKIHFFTQVPRVGKKLAQKIIIELAGKLGNLEKLQLGTLDSEHALLLEAMLALGYEEHLVYDLVSKTDMSNISLEQALQQTIRTLGNTSS